MESAQARASGGHPKITVSKNDLLGGLFQVTIFLPLTLLICLYVSPIVLDWNDEWLFDVSTLKWRQIGATECVRNKTICTDASTLTQILTQFSEAASPSSPLNFDTLLRPSQVYTIVQQLQSAIDHRNLQPGTLVDDPHACSTSCAEYAVDENRLKPPKAEGSRMVLLDGYVWLFGGYACNANGQQTQGGEQCYHNSMYVMNTSTLEWEVIHPPAPTSEWSKYWPSKRAYHNMVAHEGRKLLFVEGGAFQVSHC